MEMVYTTISGHRITFEEPSADLKGFLEAIIGDAHDVVIDEAYFIAEVFAADNPIMGEGIIPERPVITRETIRHPLYRVFLDLIDRKHIAQHGIDVNELAAGFSMSITEAAAELDLHVSTVRQLVTTFRLPSWYRGGAYWLRPETVRVYKARVSQGATVVPGMELDAAQAAKLRGAAAKKARAAVGPRTLATKRKKKATKSRLR